MHLRAILSLFFILALLAGQHTPFASAHSSAAIAQPTLKWSRGGCYSSWCETGWYSSPAIADLDGDKKGEVIGSAYSIFTLDGKTGNLKWSAKSGHDRSQPNASNVGRTWPGVVVADIDHNGDLEIVTAHSGGWLSIYDHQGYFQAGWPKQVPPGKELRSLGVYDLDGDGSLEIMVASTHSENQWFVYQPNGSLRPAYWPQHYPDSSTNGYTHGAYNQNLAAGDLDGDRRAEIVGPNDTHYVAAFEDDGSQIRANAMYKNKDGSTKVWSQVGLHVSHDVDLRGYANCGTEHRPNLANSSPTIVDVNGDGKLEVIVVGNVYNCATDPYTDLYEMPFIFNGDRTRWKASGFDWTVIPTPEPNSAPLSEDYNKIETSLPNPAIADLDGDGLKEILYPSYDGRLHAYWLDKTEHGSWPYAVKKSNESFIRFASEPVVADLDNNGKAEVLFASWTQKGSGQVGKLHLLDDQGSPLWEVNLPFTPGSDNWDGALAAPTIGNIDDDPDMEVVVNTAHSGLVGYDLPGTANARLLWATGRGSFQRSGSLMNGLNRSTRQADKIVPVPGDLITHTITLVNYGPLLNGVTLTESVPTGLAYSGGLVASSGTVTYNAGTIHWTGRVDTSNLVTIQYQVQVDPAITGQPVITTVATVNDSLGNTLSLPFTFIVNGLPLYLPMTHKP